MPQLHILFIESFDPAQNLVFENNLYEQLPAEDMYVLIWRNSDAIVIGRAQNPWLEANIDYAAAHNIPLLRRTSGGGTVYHDLHNINFTFMAHKPFYHNKIATQIVNDVLVNLGFNTSVNDRNDILLKDNDRFYKISGSAYRENIHKGLHHGTILVSANLPKLRAALKPHNPHLITNSIKSMRTSVMNLADVQPAISIDEITSALTEQFKKQLSPANDVQIKTVARFTQTDDFIQALHKQTSWEWNFGKTPKFTQEMNGSVSNKTIIGAMEVNQGIIQSISLAIPSLSAADHNAIQAAFTNMPYLKDTIQGKLQSLPSDNPIFLSDLCTWIFEKKTSSAI